MGHLCVEANFVTKVWVEKNPSFQQNLRTSNGGKLEVIKFGATTKNLASLKWDDRMHVGLRLQYMHVYKTRKYACKDSIFFKFEVLYAPSRGSQSSSTG
jgi:hypothetical protein